MATMQIETNITDWSVIMIIGTKIKITLYLKKKIQHVHQFPCHIILGFKSNDIKIKTYVKIRNMSNQGHFGL